MVSRLSSHSMTSCPQQIAVPFAVCIFGGFGEMPWRPLPPKIQGCRIDQQIQRWLTDQLQNSIANKGMAWPSRHATTIRHNIEIFQVILITDQYFTVKFNAEFKPPSQKIQIAKARRFKNSERRSAFHDHYCIDSCFICVKENEKRSFFQRMRSMPTKCCINPFNQTAKVKTTGTAVSSRKCGSHTVLVRSAPPP